MSDAMHPKVTQAIVDAYQDVGVAHIKGAVSTQWIADMTRVLDGAIADLRAKSYANLPTSLLGPAEFEDHDGYIRLIKLYWHDPHMRKVVEQSDCAEIVADVIGSDSMQPWIDGTFIKEGRDAQTATPWHNDECLFPLRGEHSPSMWIALTDVDLDNAPLQTLAASNKDKHRYVSSWAKDGAQPPPNFHPWSELLERVKSPGADIRVWPAKAGDMIVLHPKTIHASLPRTTLKEGRRIGFSLRWIGSDIRYEHNPTARTPPFQGLAAVTEGAPIPDSVLPIVWRRLPSPP
jgi:ectoine hydroxylase-related dioxygenase (phytanoyl-CoA dioxygenase family)